MGDEFKLWIFGLYAVIILFGMGGAVWTVKRRNEKINNLQQDLKSKIKNDFELTSQDITLIGSAYDLSASSSRLALYRVYKDIDKKDDFKKLKTLVEQLQKDEPFDTMPDEVKPSLSRISNLASDSPVDSDKHILTPITNILTKYQDLLEEQKKTKKQASIAYTLTVASFFVGAISLYYAFVSPSAKDIAAELIQIEETNSHNNKPIKPD
ncbi:MULTISPECIES: hypothetical protein [Shewanella]|uniref:Uncharacterized protein n=1 Tax=Shewanella psychromarinicola TaxID=2487742 RepID=A0A3N4DAP2_9GAMM|nr:hypothetical protein [Shewanella psychromarinicola]AZG35787.1 hypothetical protein EGC80_13450 [Shewanella psychromarinicola]MCL1083855.1 hypothetical protein [Shewanella psychromarinicola]RPA22696.1 hypothetical protein EGC77_21095 [Shewanella psychromarinicola]